jgi:hypothetical protein
MRTEGPPLPVGGNAGVEDWSGHDPSESADGVTLPIKLPRGLQYRNADGSAGPVIDNAFVEQHRHGAMPPSKRSDTSFPPVDLGK